MTASRKDTAPTQKEILEHNLFLEKMGCAQNPSNEPNLFERFRHIIN